ncbi:cell division protein FtsZ [bacterium]|jgi:cell division protein FtsZ|nr:cell division protein FtsZ [bacterium]MBT4251232.1 cell division protein FtsZ [bacterium]MBT4597976.1 cell division protein FtsZ [bacterium]MBT6753611.1 cell division protein FtsZ [bacterium]MBT7037726.1 cell division protein FtsZ [bacterium]
MAEVKPDIETFARIKVVGVGGSGSNAISRMIECNMKGIDFVAINTDAQDLHHNKAAEKIHIGKNLTRGLGAGMNPEIGRQAAEENRDEIQEVLKGTDMIFIVYGAGGGTGSGAGPVIAEAAKEAGALTVGVITRPFMFEGKQRAAIAEESLENLKDRVDTLISIQNDKLLQVIDRNTSLVDSFGIVDDVLRQGVQGISDLITKPGIVNVDFADVNAVMQESGSALMGIGVASGEDRAIQAAKSAINSPLLDVSIDGAKGVLFNITGGEDVTMVEINEAASIITETVDSNAKIIFGASSTEENFQGNDLKEGELKITVVATGFEYIVGTENSFTRPSRDKIRLDDDEREQTPTQKTSTVGNTNPTMTTNPTLNHTESREMGDSQVQGEDFAEKSRFEKLTSTFLDRGADEESREGDSNMKFDDDLSIPAPTPKPKNNNEIPAEKSPFDDDSNIDDLEIPAFIRKKLGR